MDLTTIRRMIGQCREAEELQAVIKAAQDRLSLLRRRRKEEELSDAWERVRKAKRGQVLLIPVARKEPVYCEDSNGKFYAAPVAFAAGTTFEITHIQPRIKRVWVTCGLTGPRYMFTTELLKRWQACAYPDELTAQVAFASQHRSNNTQGDTKCN